MTGNLTKWGINLLFPAKCPVCGEVLDEHERRICSRCMPKLSFVEEPVCLKCGRTVISDSAEYCFDCTRHKKTFEYGVSLLNYNEAAKKIMVQLKYKNQRDAADELTMLLAKRWSEKLKCMHVQALIPVPVHSSRKRKRGYNQAEIIADDLGKVMGLPVLKNVLIRNRRTAPQKELSAQKRLNNLLSAFEIETIPAGLSSVLLVDDIYTTGSTAEACSRALKQAGIKTVYLATICIAGGEG